MWRCWGGVGNRGTKHKKLTTKNMKAHEGNPRLGLGSTVVFLCDPPLAFVFKAFAVAVVVDLSNC